MMLKTEYLKAREAIYWCSSRGLIFGFLVLVIGMILADAGSDVLLAIPTGIILGQESWGSAGYRITQLVLMLLFWPRSIMAARWLMRRLMPFWLH